MVRLYALFGVILIGAWTTAVTPVHANLAGDATTFVQQSGDQLLKILDEPAGTTRRADFRSWLERVFNLKTVAQLALGPYRSTATSQQLSAYDKAFADYIVVTYEARFNTFTGYTFKVGQARPLNQDNVAVRTTISDPSGKPTLVDFRVQKSNGNLKVLDVAVEGVSMLRTQRDEFASVIQRNGMDGLIKSLKQRTAAVQAAGN